LKKGYSLIESLLSLSLFLFVVLACFELFGFARNIFLKLKSHEEMEAAVFSALDKMKTDLHEGGSGIIDPIHLGLLKGITEDEGTLTILSKEKNLTPLDNLAAGQTRISLNSTSNLKRKREICIFDSVKGEANSVLSVQGKDIILSFPLSFSYEKEKTSLLLVKKVSFFFDEDKQIIRRKVNTSPSQPLLEEVALFEFTHEKCANLVRLRLAPLLNKEKKYEISVYPKNTALGAEG